MKQNKKDTDIVSRLVRRLMKKGDKAGAHKLLLNSICLCKNKVQDKLAPKLKQGVKYQTKECQSVSICNQTINNIKPSVEVRKVRIGGTFYQVPFVGKSARQEAVATQWLLDCLDKKRSKSKQNSYTCLGKEFFDIIQNQGAAVQKRDQLHSLAASNRAYTRYRWW